MVPGPKLCLPLLLLACSAEPPAPAPPAPVQLAPTLKAFQDMAAAAPTPLSEAHATALADLVQTAFTSSNKGLQAKARRSLFDHPDVDRGLIASLQDSAARVRSMAAFELGNRGTTVAIPELLRRLKDEADAEPKLYLADALARLGNLSALPVIAAAMHSAQAQTAGLMAIAVLRQTNRTVAKAPSYDQLSEAVTALHRYWRAVGRLPGTPPGMPELEPGMAAHLVRFEGFQLRQVDEARHVLARMGQAAVPLLCRAITAEEPYLRQHSMEVLRQLGRVGRPAEGKLRRLLERPDCRAEAATTLGEIGAQTSVQALLTHFDDADIEVRCAIVHALGLLQDERVVPRLQPLLSDGTVPIDLQVQAAFSLTILEPGGPGLAFLSERRELNDYHRPTVDELLDKAMRWSAR